MGTVIYGTMRPEDLIPTFLKELELRDQCEAVKLSEEFDLLVERYIFYDEPNCWAESEDAYELLDALIDALHNTAPEGYYFGAHLGNNTDFGFWRYETDADEELEELDDYADTMHSSDSGVE